MSDTAKTFLKSIIYLSIAIIPFLAWYVPDAFFFPFITGKNFAFRFLVTIAFLSYFVLTLYDKPSRPKRSLIFYSYFVFLAVLFVANILGVNSSNSFYSNFERMEGFFTHLYLFLYFVVVYSIYNLDKDFLKLFGYFAVANFFILVEGFLQLLGANDFWSAGFLQNNASFVNIFTNAYPVHMGGGLRLDATLGNAAYYGIFTLFFFFISILLAVKNKKWKKCEGGGVLLGLFLSCLALLSKNLMLVYANTLVNTNRGLAVSLSSFANFVWFVGLIAAIYFAYLFVKKLAEEGISSYVFVLFAIMNAISLYYTQTRGSYIGFAAGVLLVLYIFFANKILKNIKSNFVKYLLAIGGIFVLLLGFYFTSACSFKYIRENVEVKGFFLKRVATIKLPCEPSEISKYISDSKRLLAGEGTYPELVDHFGEATIVSRFLNAKISIDAIRERPWLGYGEDNYTNVFSKYSDPRMYAQEEWFDRSHDVFFDWLVAGGIVGLSAYLMLYLSPMYMMWISKRRKNIDFNERAILTGALVAYFIHNILVFDNLISYIIFITIIAYVASKTFSEKFILSNWDLPHKDKIRVASIIVVLVFFSFLMRKTILSPISSNLNTISMIKEAPTKIEDLTSSVKRSQSFSENAISGNSFGKKEAINQSLAKIASYISAAPPASIPEQYRNDYVNALLSYKNYTEGEFLKSIYENFTIKDQVYFAAYFNQIGDYANSNKYFASAYAYAPKKQSIAIRYVSSLLAEGQYKEALLIAKNAYELEKTNNKAREVYLEALFFVDKKTYTKELNEYKKIDENAAKTLDNNLKSVKI